MAATPSRPEPIRPAGEPLAVVHAADEAAAVRAIAAYQAAVRISDEAPIETPLIAEVVG